MFGKSNRITLNHVRDTVYAAEGEEELALRVDENVMMLARRIRGALNDVEQAKEDPEKIEQAARSFARAVFGAEQAEKLTAFYSGNIYAVFEFTSKYFTGRLSRKITEMQKRAKIV